MKRCRICNRLVPWVVINLSNPEERLYIAMTEERTTENDHADGICLPCLDRIRQRKADACLEIKITCN